MLNWKPGRPNVGCGMILSLYRLGNIGRLSITINQIDVAFLSESRRLIGFII
jgi:hypothetical protein